MTSPVASTEHTHTWGPVEFSRFAGNPNRACTGCWFVSLDLYDEDAELDA